jgi:hypothetical protein
MRKSRYIGETAEERNPEETRKGLPRDYTRDPKGMI